MKAFWNGGDLLVWVGLLLPSLLLAGTLARMFPLNKTPKQMAAQFLAYLIWFVLLKLLLLLKYNEPFWRSLGWEMPPSGLWLCLLGGPILAVGLNLVALVLKAPPVKAPMEDMLFDRRWRFVYGIAAVVLGPLSEELAFRGFLLPLVSKWFGVAAGIVITGFFFALAHGQQYGWFWQQVAVLSLAGFAFGLVRWKYSSTMASMVLHASFNLTVFVAQLSR